MRTAVQLTLTAAGAWLVIAQEDQQFVLAERAEVRFGTGDRWNVLVLEAGTHPCGRQLFGDPAYGVLKRCEVRAFNGEVPPPPPVNRDPVWDTSLIIFEQGVAAALDLRTRASDPDGDPLAFAVVAPSAGLPAGFSWAADTYRLAYDGSDLGLVEGDQPIEFDTELRLSADDGRAPATFQ